MTDTEHDDGGPAFPTEQGHCPDGLWNQTFDPGMTLWDYYAAHRPWPPPAEWGDGSDVPDAADWSADYADAMLAERRKRFP